jgi:hypothetical protein
VLGIRLIGTLIRIVGAQKNPETFARGLLQHLNESHYTCGAI